MILDKQNIFSEAQAVTASAASTNVIDLGTDSTRVFTPNEKGDFEILCMVTTAFADGTSIAAKLQTDDDEAFGSATDIVTTPAIATASLKAGYKFKIAVPGNALSERYARLYYTVVGTMSAGKITAGIVLDEQTGV